MKKIALVGLMVFVLSSHDRPLPQSQAQDSPPLQIFAAASLTEAFQEIGAAFQAEHPGAEVAFNFGGSSDLAAQIIEGAPADVFASANIRQMRRVQAEGLLAGWPHTFAKNRLVLIVPADNPAGIQSLEDLSREGVLLVLAAPGVPARDYTEALLDSLAGPYGEDYPGRVRANVASEEENVRLVAAKVALGEADAGIVYVSDLTPELSAAVLALPIPDEHNTLANYPIAVLAETGQPDLARAFVAYVLSEAGQAILAKWNFVPFRLPRE
jgi:molybdate transport system substrate-binding protein